MPQWDHVFTNYQLLTMQPDSASYGRIPNGSLAVADGKIAWLGPTDQLPAEASGVPSTDGQGRFMSPGLIDCHTHLVYGGSRADEFEQRMSGVGYEEISRRGGGILSTVRATRSESEEQLLESARRRLVDLRREGVTTCEIKSGYGLDLETELKMLRVATRLRGLEPVEISRTLLAAHAIPPEYRDRSDDYIDLVCQQIIPAAVELAEAVDVFCETIAFDLSQTKRVFQQAAEHGLRVKVHAEQLSLSGAARLAAEYQALSADHLEYLDEAGVQQMSQHGTVAVLLPGAYYCLRETQRPPVELLRRYQVPIAIATDANPGSSPVGSLLLMLNMACVLFELTPQEALAGVTRNAARALGLQNQVGTLEVGKQADLAVWEISSPAELAYRIGDNPCTEVYHRGRQVHAAVR